MNDTKLVPNEHEWPTESFRINLVSFRASRGPLLYKPVSWLGPFFAVSYSKPALVSSYFTYLHTYWKLKRKIDFVSWPAQHFLLVIKKLYFFPFPPSCFVCSSEPTSVWWWKLPSSTKLQFSFSIFCLHWWKKSNLQIDVPKLWMPVSMKNQSFLGKTWYGRSN